MTVLVTFEEGGKMFPYQCGLKRSTFIRLIPALRREGTIRSIHFRDGAEWDFLNGWRRATKLNRKSNRRYFKYTLALRLREKAEGRR